MSVRLAKLAVAFLYAATVVVVLKEFSGHGHSTYQEPSERPPEAIQTGLVAEVAKFVLKSPEQRRAVFGGEIRTDVPFCLLLLSTIFIDTSAHDHPTDHKHPKTKRRGKKFDWREWVLTSLKHQIACNSPPSDNLRGHQPIIRRIGENLILTS